jgi:hypothetical protein
MTKRESLPAAWRLPLVVTASAIAGLFLGACEPTVKVEAPDKPIVINLNVKIEQDVRIHVEQDAQNLLQNRSDLF